MGADSKIQWCHHTFNPWWGCQRVSPGCEHCYAETFSHRLGRDLWGPKADRKIASDSYWKQPIKWNAAAAKAGQRARVFCASMADVFESRPDLVETRARLWELIANTPQLDWLLLTKRPENFAGMLPWMSTQGIVSEPWPNVWLGTTIEDQKRAAERVPLLIAAPTVVRFLSAEPLLERVDVVRAVGQPGEMLRGVIDWVIIGGESGPGARPFGISWARDLLEQARTWGAAPFVKQMGAMPMEYRKGNGGVWDGELVKLGLRDRKGGDVDEWPEDLRVREFPR